MFGHMTDWHTPGEHEPAIDPNARLQQIREAFVDDVLRGLFCLAMVILPISVWRNALGPQGLRLPAALFMLSTTTAVLGVTWLSRKRLAYGTKAGALLLVLFFTGAGGLISFGQAAPTGNYFAMGDNRDDSLDSRTRLLVRDGSGASHERDQLGWYVPAENLVGRAEFIFFSHDPSAAGWLEPWKWPGAIRFGRLFMAIH